MIVKRFLFLLIIVIYCNSQSCLIWRQLAVGTSIILKKIEEYSEIIIEEGR